MYTCCWVNFEKSSIGRHFRNNRFTRSNCNEHVLFSIGHWNNSIDSLLKVTNESSVILPLPRKNSCMWNHFFLIHEPVLFTSRFLIWAISPCRCLIILISHGVFLWLDSQLILRVFLFWNAYGLFGGSWNAFGFMTEQITKNTVMSCWGSEQVAKIERTQVIALVYFCSWIFANKYQ